MRFIKNNVFTILGTWKDHFNSWTKNNSNVLIIRYEDLLLNTITEINKIIKFINNYIDFDYDDMCDDGSDDYEPMHSVEETRGYCKKCKGIGKVFIINEKKIIPDTNLSISNGAIHPLRNIEDKWIITEVETILKK